MYRVSAGEASSCMHRYFFIFFVANQLINHKAYSRLAELTMNDNIGPLESTVAISIRQQGCKLEMIDYAHGCCHDHYQPNISLGFINGRCHDLHTYYIICQVRLLNDHVCGFASKCPHNIAQCFIMTKASPITYVAST